MGLEKSSWLGLCAVLLAAAPASAQNQRYYPQSQGGYTPPPPQYSQPPPNYQQAPQGYGYGYPQQQPQTRYESPIEFLPKFGKRMSEIVRRVFYGRDSTGYDYPQQGGANGGYSLEEPPRQYSAAPTYPQQPPSTGIYPPPSSYPRQSQPQPGYQYPPQQGQGQSQPRYSYPPQSPAPTTPRSTQPLPQSKSTAPSTQSKSGTTTRTYSPPKVTQTPPKTTTPKSSSTSSSSSSTPKSSKPKDQPPAPAPTPPPTTTTRRSESTPPPSSSSSNTSSLGSGSFLKGKKASKPGRVISPYPPYKELDITGLESGSLALDPTTQKVFEVP